MSRLTLPTKLLLFCVLFVAGIAITHAEEGQWQKQKDADGIQIYTRSKANSPINEVLGKTVLPVPHWVVMNVVSDFANYKDFMPNTTISKELKRQGHTIYSYQYLDIPIISNRDYVIAVKNVSYRTDKETIVYKTQWRPSIEIAPPLPKDTVRVEINEGHWILKSAQQGKATQASYYLYTAPGGQIPAWAANQGNTRTIPKMFEAIVAQSRLKKYWQTKPQVP